MRTRPKRPHNFGEYLRVLRIAKGVSLRKFAEDVGVSATYLSQVEKGNTDSPTAERVTRMAALLEQDSDELIALAGRVPIDLREIIQAYPSEISELVRETKGLSVKQIRKVTEQIRKLKKK